MPFRSMSPLTVERTSVSVILRAAAMFASPAVRHEASACRTNSTGVGALSWPTSTAGWSAPKTNVRSCWRSSPTPKKSLIDERLWVPFIHSLWARNWNCAAAGACLTASSVANNVDVSTPLRRDGLVSVMVIAVSFLGAGTSGGSVVGNWWSRGHQRQLWAGGKNGCLGLDRRAQLLLQLDEAGRRRERDELARDVEHLAQQVVAKLVVFGERFGLVRTPPENAVQTGRQQ